MKELEVVVKSMVEGLRTLSQGVDAIAKNLEDGLIDKKPEKKAKPKKAATKKKAPAKKAPAKKKTASGTVFAIINRSKKGVDTALLVKKTGFGRKKVSNILFRLSKQGKIKSASRGVYTKV